MLRNHLIADLDLRIKSLSGTDLEKRQLKERFIANSSDIEDLFLELYGHQKVANQLFDALIDLVFRSFDQRADDLKKADLDKLQKEQWFCSQEISGMSLYVDRFAGKLPDLERKLDYIEDLGVNLLHLMPLFESPEDASDGGYAVSDFKKVNPKYGSLED